MTNSKPVSRDVQPSRLDFPIPTTYNRQMHTNEYEFTVCNGEFRIEAVVAAGDPGSYWTAPMDDEITDMAVFVGNVDITELLSDVAERDFQGMVWEHLEAIKRGHK